MKSLLVFFAFPFTAIASTSPTDTPDTAAVITVMLQNDFPGSELLFFQKADLNLDGQEDLVIVATRSCDDNEEGIGDENHPVTCRKVIIAINSGNGSYKPVSSSDHFIECSLCGGGWSLHDAYNNLTAGDGWIAAANEYGACEREIIYERYTYDKSREHWYRTVHRIETFSCKAEDPSETELYKLVETPVEEAMLKFGE